MDETEPLTPSTTPRVAVVGAGPSGLVMARAARQAGAQVVVYERHSDVGGIWDPDNSGSPMYESAHFISSRYASGFYGAPMPESFPDYPGYKLIRDYIRGFAAQFDLYRHVRLNTGVAQAEKVGETWAVTDTNGRTESFTHLVSANGVTWHPRIPHYPGLETFTGEYRHSATFRHPSEFACRRVLIVGGGNSGVDIASDAARNAETAFWSVRRGYRIVPKHLFGVPLDRFDAEKSVPPGITIPGNLNDLVDALVGDLSRFGLPAPDHDVLTSHPIVNDAIVHHLSHGDIAGKPDVAEFRGDTVVFTDGSSEQIDLVLFATGYDYRIPYLDESLFTWKHGHPELYLNMFNRDVDNLYVLGFIEFADAAYKRLDEMAQLIALDITATGTTKAELQELKRSHHPDLRGGVNFIDSPRHSSYVETRTFQNTIAELRDRFGLPRLDDQAYPIAHRAVEAA
jgi:flavin-binding monooxygenase-like protein